MGIIAILIGVLPVLIKAIREGISLFETTPEDRDALLASLDEIEKKLDAVAARVAAYTPIPKPQ